MCWKIKIRKARKDDIKFIKEMDDLYLKARHSIDYFLRNIDNLLIALDGKKVIGYIMYEGDEVLNLIVHPDYRKKGIGKELMKEIMGNSEILVCRTRENNKEAFVFLKKLGFREKQRIKGYYKNGDNAIEMEWVR